MLTRLKVSGFKNLVDVDVRFGPFTCVAGVNGVGKSNLFDAIRFLSALADNTLMDAALSVRAEGERTGDVRSLFHRVGDQYDNEVSFEAEMIVPRYGRDDLGQEVETTTTYLRYSLVLGYHAGAFSSGFSSDFDIERFEIIKEELVPISQSDARDHLVFPHSPKWRKSVVKGRQPLIRFISTTDRGNTRVILLHNENAIGAGVNQRQAIPTRKLERTVLSVSNTADSPTVLMARREMQSWRLLQLEPSALRKPDSFSDPARLGSDGSHLAATLYRLARSKGKAEDVYSQTANRLAELIDDVREIWIDRDEKRALLTIQVKDWQNTTHAASALSDGTLRFLALTVVELDPEVQGILCIEEPENGIHPRRIPAMLRLLRDTAMDVNYPIGEDNPIRQVIINTHSPAIVQQVPADSLLVAELKDTLRSGQRFKRASFGYLPNTWRHAAQEDQNDQRNIVSIGTLLAYLGTPWPETDEERVIDRSDIQSVLQFDGSNE